MKSLIADVKTVFKFTGELNDEQMLLFLSHYLDQLKQQQQKIQQLITLNNIRAIRPIVHNIKSNALYIKALTLSSSCKHMEKLIDQQATEAILLFWPKLSKQFTQVIIFLQEVINANQGT
jgi:HPt (histidine-containing phosphotransfer) domain-containing protein